MEQKIKKLVIFGTLFNSEMGGIKDLLILLGKGKIVKEIDREYQKRKWAGPWGLKELIKLFKGFSVNQIKEISLEYCQQKLLTGLREACDAFKKEGFLIGAITSNPQFMMDIVKDILSLNFSEGTQLEFKNEIATGKIYKEVNRYTKAKILQEKRKKYRIKKGNVIIIGRLTPAHLPSSKEVGVYIGFEPKKESISDVARMIVTNNKLRDIFKKS